MALHKLTITYEAWSSQFPALGAYFVYINKLSVQESQGQLVWSDASE